MMFLKQKLFSTASYTIYEAKAMEKITLTDSFNSVQQFFFKNWVQMLWFENTELCKNVLNLTGLCKEIRCCVWQLSSLCVQITKSDIRLQIKWAVSLVIAA